MATTVAQHTVATFTSPVNGTTPIDANTVRGNDNTIRSSYNDHDSDPGIHVQSSTLASRPAAGTAGRKWITADAGEYKLWYDDGTRWNEVGNDAVDVSFIADGNIVKGDVLKLTGWNNGQNLPTLGPATVSGDVCFAIATETVTNGNRSFAINTGFIEDVDTSAFSTGDILYPSNAAGPGTITSWFQNTKPTSGNYQMAAYVIRDNASNGVLFVEFTGPRIVERSDNTASTVVLRDASGDFSAGTVTVGALTSTGLVTFASLKGTGATTVTNILDEDNMASDSDTALATQQSIKAYVDSQVGTVDTLAEILANGNTSGGTNLIMSAGDTLTVDTIAETTSGAGVTIDSVLLKDDVVNATDVETGTVSANDGTLAITVANSTGALTLASALADSNLATISTAGKVANSATTADSANTASAIVARDGSGNFSAGTITAALTGNASTATALSSSRTFALTGDVTGSVSSDLTSGASISTSIAAGSIVDADISATAEIAVSKLADGAARQVLQTDAAGTGVEWTDSIDLPGTLTINSTTTITGIIDDDTMATASDTTLATSESIKAYVDTQLTAEDLDFAGDGGTTGSVDLDSQSLTIAGTTNQVSTSASGQTLTISLPSVVDLPGTLDVTGATTLDSTLTVTGDANFDSGTLFVDVSTDRVGIGTTSPTTALHVRRTSGASIVKSNSTDTASYASLDAEGNDGSGTLYRFGSTYSTSAQYIASSTLLESSTGPLLLSAAAAETVRVYTNAAERMRIDSSGRVLVGTTSTTNNIRAEQKLAVVGAGSNIYPGASFTGYAGTGNYYPLIDIQKSAGTTDGSMTALSSGDGIGAIAFRGSDGTNFKNSVILTALVDGTVASNQVPGALRIETASSSGTVTERMRIDSSGQVGIGTTAPDASEWNGSARLLHVYQNTINGAILKVESSNAAGVFAAQNNSIAIGATTNDPMLFLTNTTERMRITSGGDVGIGTSSPTGKLYVQASGLVNVFTAFSTGAGAFSVDRIANTSPYNRFTFANGDIRISASSKIAVPGSGVTNINVDSAGDLTTSTSDKRKKEHVSYLTDALSVIDAVDPVRYYWKDDEKKVQFIGFYAQDAYDVLPELVYRNPRIELNLKTQEHEPTLDEDGNPDYTWGMNQDGLIAVLWQAVKEQQSTIESLESRLSALENA